MFSVTEVQREMALAEKRRKGRDLRAGQAAGEEAAAAERAGKAFRDRGITEGPAHLAQSGHSEPQDYERPYLEAGHAAESPMAEPPRQSPITHAPPGILQPIALPAGPRAMTIPARISAGYSLGSPSERPIRGAR
jgi:hypothetical protein